MKIIWKVDPKPTGRYRSFQQRQWPTAWCRDQLVAQLISVEGEAYWPKIGEDTLLKVYVYDYREGPQNRKTMVMKVRPVGVKNAKILVKGFYERNPHLLPE